MSLDRLRQAAEDASGRHDPCAICDGDGPWGPPWAVVDDVKGDGHWDNEFHVVAEGGEGQHLATFEYGPHAHHLATFDPPTVKALLDVAECAAEIASDDYLEQPAPYATGIRIEEAVALTEAVHRLRNATSGPDKPNIDATAEGRR